MSTDDSLHAQITKLVETEKQLRQQLANGEISRDEEHRELKDAETQLDQLWDLLRQRDARREFGENPDEATPRPSSVVEDYES